MASYRQFTQEERILLSALNRRGLTQKEIARELQKHQSSISRELERNKKEHGGYHAGYAKQTVRQRREEANAALKRIENDPWLARYLIRKLKRYWSPEQIAVRVRKDHGIIVCHETIYQYIYRQRPDLKKYLRCQKGKYLRRYGTRIREKQREEAKKKRIDARPEIVEKKGRIGDWEGDTIVGKERKIHILTHVDRKSGVILADKLDRATAKQTRIKTIKRFRTLSRNRKHTIT